jgi:hypothetical protein
VNSPQDTVSAVSTRFAVICVKPCPAVAGMVVQAVSVITVSLGDLCFVMEMRVGSCH